MPVGIIETKAEEDQSDREAEKGVPSESRSGRDDDSDGSGSDDSEDLEEERQREEERSRRRAERLMAMAARAITEREEAVARLEGEKISLEKLLALREKEYAQEASELQTCMIETNQTMEATEMEKQRHHNTRMEALVRLAELEEKLQKEFLELWVH